MRPLVEADQQADETLGKKNNTFYMLQPADTRDHWCTCRRLQAKKFEVSPTKRHNLGSSVGMHDAHSSIVEE